MIAYQSKSGKISGTNLKEVSKNAKIIYKDIVSKTKRNPYIRSAYFKKNKVFFTYFWEHLRQKSPKKRFYRLQYFKVAIELIKSSRNQPTIEKRSTNKKEILYRFIGLTKDKELFYVQIKEDRKIGKKYFMSCFPDK
ncbi:hypothetical protein ACFL23_00690 [Patescibacteria group bacterium]